MFTYGSGTIASASTLADVDNILYADAQTVLLEMTTAFAMAHTKKQLLRDDISKAQTQSDLDNISW